MTLHSVLHKCSLLLLVTTVVFSVVTTPAPVVADPTSMEFGNTILSLLSNLRATKNCTYYSPTCTAPLVRKEWYTLSNTQKKKFINAVLCLSQNTSLPAIHSQFPGTVNRLDDYTAVHANQTPFIHTVGHFLHWHRYFLVLVEKALRTECAYDGSIPYWNLANDLASGQDMNDWDIFDNHYGFGGNGPNVSHDGAPNLLNISGATGGGCVPGGPFGAGSQFKVNLGPGPSIYQSNPTCLKRDFSPSTIVFANQGNVTELMNQPDFASFTKAIDVKPDIVFRGIHPAVHLGVGGLLGQVADNFVSPSDPLFYLHHANLDRIYWQWQLRSPIKRLCEVGGPVIPLDYTLTQGPAVTLNFMVNINVMGPPIRIRDLLSTVANPCCYVYDRLI